MNLLGWRLAKFWKNKVVVEKMTTSSSNIPYPNNQKWVHSGQIVKMSQTNSQQTCFKNSLWSKESLECMQCTFGVAQ